MGESRILAEEVSMPGRIHAVMPAAGRGLRVGSTLPKQFLPINGEPMIAHAARAMLAVDWIDRLTVVVAHDDRERAEALFAGWSRIALRAVGGPSRRDSVLAGLDSIEEACDDDWVLVHDAARPGLPRVALEALRAAAIADPVGALLAVPVSDTIKRDDGGHPPRVDVTIPREQLWAAQTPQMFRFGLLRDALVAFSAATDEAAAIEAAGHRPRLVEGHRANFKVTTVGDLAAMAAVLAARAQSPTTGRS
jgi:2-C-methyl-D-erythritol 4-phosphate cytidylyltransferase